MCKRNIANVISLTVFQVIWKERNDITFNSVESSTNGLKDRWIHYVGSTLLGDNMISDVDFGNVIDTLTSL